MFREYSQYDALGLAQLIAKGEITSLECLEAAIAQYEKLNPRINAVIHTFFDRARETARQALPEGPFKGVPFVLKDLLDHYAGEPMSMGSRGIHLISDFDSERVKRYKKSGVVIFGKTNTPEFGMSITTEPKAFGATCNPWNISHSSGGSSGGSAAAVAAGIVPMASGSDGGGSIRFPAAACGLFGLKPSRGRNPEGPDIGEDWDGASTGHVITRSVRDSAAMLDCLSGPETGAPFRIPRTAQPFLSALEQDPKPLRIAICQQPFIDAPLHMEAVTGLQQTAQLLASMGHHVEEAMPAIDREALAESFLVVVAANIAHQAQRIKELCGRKAFSQLEPEIRCTAMLGYSLSARDFQAAKYQWHLIQYSLGQFLQQYDLLLTPTLIEPPVLLGTLTPSRLDDLLFNMGALLPTGKLLLRSGIAGKMVQATLQQLGFTVLGNITGLPSMSLPLHWTRDGLPLGMLFTGRMGDEYRMLQLAGQVERAQNWQLKQAPLCD
jgi:amidase